MNFPFRFFFRHSIEILFSFSVLRLNELLNLICPNLLWNQLVYGQQIQYSQYLTSLRPAKCHLFHCKRNNISYAHHHNVESKNVLIIIIIIRKDLCKSENDDTPKRRTYSLFYLTTSVLHERRMIATIYVVLKTGWAFQFENHFSFPTFVKENVILHSGNNFIFRTEALGHFHSSGYEKYQITSLVCTISYHDSRISYRETTLHPYCHHLRLSTWSTKQRNSLNVCHFLYFFHLILFPVRRRSVCLCVVFVYYWFEIDFKCFS